jgi:hypothetical protein
MEDEQLKKQLEEEKRKNVELLFRLNMRQISLSNRLFRLFTVLAVIFFTFFLLYKGTDMLLLRYADCKCKCNCTSVTEEPSTEVAIATTNHYPIKPVAVAGLRCKPVHQSARATMHVEEIRASMARHLMESDFDYICAQHIDVQACMCIMQVDGQLVDVVNLRITGVSSNNVVRNRESSLFCPNSMAIINVRRYESVYASMEVPSTGERFERWYSGKVAYSLQQIFEVQIGLSPCRDNLDELSERIKDREL